MMLGAPQRRDSIASDGGGFPTSRKVTNTPMFGACLSSAFPRPGLAPWGEMRRLSPARWAQRRPKVRQSRFSVDEVIRHIGHITRSNRLFDLATTEEPETSCDGSDEGCVRVTRIISRVPR